MEVLKVGFLSIEVNDNKLLHTFYCVFLGLNTYNIVMVAFTLFVGFVVGELSVIGVQVVGFFFLIQKLGRKINKHVVNVVKFGSSRREEL